MIIVGRENLVTFILRLLAVSGEYPYSSLHLIGKLRTAQRIVQKMCEKEIIRVNQCTLPGPMQLLTCSGKGALRTIRLTRDGVAVLGELDPELQRYYETHTGRNRFSGNAAHIGRNHRTAEVFAMAMRAGIGCTHSASEELTMSAYRPLDFARPAFYPSKTLKGIDPGSEKKTAWTRIVGALFYADGFYALYNTRSAAMKWSGAGELKSALMLESIAHSNSNFGRCDSAILFGKDVSTVLATMEAHGSPIRRGQRFDNIYHHVHFVSLDENGIRLLRILTSAEWREVLKYAVFPKEMQLRYAASIDCDARRGDTWILSHLDGNLARLYRFREAITELKLKAEVVAFPWQAPYVQSYCRDACNVRVVEMEQIERMLAAPYQRKGALS